MSRAAAGQSDAQLLLFEPWPLVERVSLRARSVRVDVKPDGQVVLTIPRRVSRAAAYGFLDGQREWIARTRARLLDAERRRPTLEWEGPRDKATLRALAETTARRLLDEESSRLGLRYTSLRIRDTRTRWGSCGPDGSIMLSMRLAMAPPDVFRYVVIHELCHLRWHGHGARFWGLVERQMPDYARHRTWLRRHGDALQGIALENRGRTPIKK
jgi:predicted metal-dependent hydrolase